MLRPCLLQWILNGCRTWLEIEPCLIPPEVRDECGHIWVPGWLYIWDGRNFGEVGEDLLYHAKGSIFTIPYADNWPKTVTLRRMRKQKRAASKVNSASDLWQHKAGWSATPEKHWILSVNHDMMDSDSNFSWCLRVHRRRSYENKSKIWKEKVLQFKIYKIS